MSIRRSVVVVFPNLITVGNGICGFAAVVKVLKVDVVASGAAASLQGERYLALAAWLILLGMVFDVFDGRVARFTGKTSDLGGQLDSLCDLVTFGLAPALMVVRMNMVYPTVWQNWVWFLCLVYFTGALLRLARFNVETEHEESAHLCFKGLPSPAAAGCLATMVIFYHYFMRFEARELQILSGYQETLQAALWWIPCALPILAAILGFAMVYTRLNYEHLGSSLLTRRHSFEFLASLIFGGILVAMIPEVLLPVLFIGYLLSAPLRYVATLGRRSIGREAAPPDPPGGSRDPGASPDGENSVAAGRG